MSLQLQILHRTSGLEGAPGTVDKLAGEIALNFAVPAASPPELWAFDGTAWKRVNANQTADIGFAELSGGTEGDKAGIGAAWIAYTPKPTEAFITVSYASIAYLMVGNPELDNGWTAFVSEAVASTVFDARDQAQDAATDSQGYMLSSQSAAEESEMSKDLSYYFSQEAASVACQDLSSINLALAGITGTVVDVKIYDTTKDSDKGAWRERCQGLAWYNETLNTSTRGITRKFPALALIVAETDKVTIFDLTDTNAPMWMVFEKSVTSWVAGNMLFPDEFVTSCFMLNGVLTVGHAGNIGLSICNFIKDSASQHTSLNNFGGDYQGNISQRTDELGVTMVNDLLIVDPNVNDVPMVIIDNAPIDLITGIAVPTIAVATDGGASVIDGVAGVDTVVDITWTSQNVCVGVLFDSDKIRIVHGTNSIGAHFEHVFNIPSVDLVEGVGYVKGAALAFYAGLYNAAYTGLDLVHGSGTTECMLSKDSIGGASGLTRLYEDIDTPANGMVDYTTDEYFSGIMQGDIRMATLADTTPGTLEQLWVDPPATVEAPWVDNGDGSYSIDGTQTGHTSLDAGPILASSGDHTVTFTIESVSAGGVSILLSNGISVEFTSIGIHSFTEEVTFGYLNMYLVASADFVGTVSTVSAGIAGSSPVVEDRCVKDNTLDVVGTITKTEMATGADLVAYSGFSLTDYIEQPYNSDLDFGTGDLYVMGWIDTGGDNSGSILTREDAGGGGVAIKLRVGVTDVTFEVGTQNVSYISSANKKMFVVGIRDSTGTRLYIDGALEDETLGAAVNVDNITAKLFLGTRGDLLGYWSGSLTLMRIGAGAPTDAQILEIYNLEKKLFEEDAKCTLGIGSNVTALAYDESEDTLFVGIEGAVIDTVVYFDGLIRRSAALALSAPPVAIDAVNGKYSTATASEVKVYVPALFLREELENLYKPEYYEKIVTKWTLGIATDVEYSGEDIHAVYVDGLLLNPTGYTISGTTITLSVAPVTETCIMTYRKIK